MLVTFKRFNNLNVAEAFAEKLQENGIEYTIENERKYWDISFANNEFPANILLKIEQANFNAANDVFEKYFAVDLETVDKNYYIFSFSDAELLDIVAKPDEWGYYDYNLALLILNNKGKNIDTTYINTLHQQRIELLQHQTSVKSYKLLIGYILAVLHFFPGFIAGWYLALFKKTLPNGHRFFVHTESDRQHGKVILAITAIRFLISCYWYFKTFF